MRLMIVLGTDYRDYADFYSVPVKSLSSVLKKEVASKVLF